MSPSSSRNFDALAYPLRFDRDRGRFSNALDHDAYVLGLVKQVILCAPGQRINRPSFGTPVSQLLFATLTEEISDLVCAQIRRALETWIGNLLIVDAIETRVISQTKLEIDVSYVVRATGNTGRHSEWITQ
jgi:uncharacterized protein